MTQRVERRNRDFAQIARELLPEAAAIDRREDELHGTAPGDELPEQLRTREGRRRALRETKQQLDRERDGAARRSLYAGHAHDADKARDAGAARHLRMVTRASRRPAVSRIVPSS